MKLYILILLIIFPLCANSQSISPNQPTQSNETNGRVDFEKYCLTNAHSYLVVSPEKQKSVKFTGELESMENNTFATYKDYGVELKENETQYFKLNGSEKILAIKSLYSLRLNYQNQLK